MPDLLSQESSRHTAIGLGLQDLAYSGSRIGEERGNSHRRAPLTITGGGLWLRSIESAGIVTPHSYFWHQPGCVLSVQFAPTLEPSR